MLEFKGMLSRALYAITWPLAFAIGVLVVAPSLILWNTLGYILGGTTGEDIMEYCTDTAAGYVEYLTKEGTL